MLLCVFGCANQIHTHTHTHTRCTDAAATRASSGRGASVEAQYTEPSPFQPALYDDAKEDPYALCTDTEEGDRADTSTRGSIGRSSAKGSVLSLRGFEDDTRDV